MKYSLLVRPEVELDLLEAERWYEQKQPGLGANSFNRSGSGSRGFRATPFSIGFAKTADKFVGLTRAAFLTASSSECLMILSSSML
ncbi:MAG: hypothetical protein QOJ40_1420 [Verrucomicrobiota bacterium]